MRGAWRALAEALVVAGFVGSVTLLLHGAGSVGVRLAALAVLLVGAALLWIARASASVRGLALLIGALVGLALGSPSVALVALCALAGGAAAVVALRDPEPPGERASVAAVGVALAVLVGVALWVRTRGEPAAAPVVLAQVRPREQSRCPEGMVFIAGGRFQMGSPPGVREYDEHPQHEEEVADFCMDRTEVSVRAFRTCAFCEADRNMSGGYCNLGRADHEEYPINCVDWGNANAFCRAAGKRLPTEVEWEYAARGPRGRTYAWGNDPPDRSQANLCGRECPLARRDAEWSDSYADTAPVGLMLDGATPRTGLLHMTGNVWEWVEDVYVSDAYAQRAAGGPLRARETSPPSDASLTEPRVLRGGSWINYDASIARAANRDRNHPRSRSDDVGFRCARGIR